MTSENSELVMSRLNYDIEKLKQFIYAAEQSEQEAVEIIAELKAKNAKLKEALEKIKVTIEPCKASDSCFTCKFAFCANYEVAKILKEINE